jgi:hypothetical protein
MSSNKLPIYVGALAFAALAVASLYRLLVYFPITIGGHMVGQTASFFAFTISAALSLILFGTAIRAR